MADSYWSVGFKSPSSSYLTVFLYLEFFGVNNQPASSNLYPLFISSLPCYNVLRSNSLHRLFISLALHSLAYVCAHLYTLRQASVLTYCQIGVCARLFQGRCLCSPIPRQVSVLTYSQAGFCARLFPGRFLCSPIPRQVFVLINSQAGFKAGVCVHL